MDLILGLIIIVVMFVLLYYMFTGACYLPSRKELVERMVKLAGVKKGDKFADIGSGDGRVVIAFAKAGAEAHGYEINPVLVWIARKNIKKAGLEKRAFIHTANFWSTNFDKFDIVTVYQITHIMGMLERKLKREMQKGSRVICSSFNFPKWKCAKRDKSLFLYKR